MRIIGGKNSGTILAAPKGFGIRPTADCVREAIFNRLAPRMPRARVLDLFSGTGALGLECLSRGAATVLSIEHSSQHLRFLKENIRACRYPPNQIQVRLACVFKTICDLAANAETFDLILADPPFGPKTVQKRSQSLAQQLIDAPHLLQLATPITLLALGRATRDKIEIPSHWIAEKTHQYGDATIHYLTKENRTQPEPLARRKNP